MLTLGNVTTEVSLEGICLLESAFGHEWNAVGNEDFCKKYEDNIEDFRKELSHGEFCYLLGYLKYRDPSFKYDSSVKLEGYFLEMCDQALYEAQCYDEIESIDEMYKNALECFKERGFLFSEVSEVF